MNDTISYSNYPQYEELDIKFMSLAIELAKKGRFTYPNPKVGCVLTKKNQDGAVEIIGQGWHKGVGMPHAEINALNSVQDKSTIHGCTAYLTLEPCSHYGNTPPCVKALIKAKITKVFIASLDPNPKIKSIDLLQRHGINVNLGLLENESKAINLPFYKTMTSGLPWIIAKFATSIDGKVATISGESKWITSLYSRLEVQLVRNRVQGIIVGINTILNDNPSYLINFDSFQSLTADILESTKEKLIHEYNCKKSIRTPNLIILDSNLSLAELTNENFNIFKKESLESREIFICYVQNNCSKRKISNLQHKNIKLLPILSTKKGKLDLNILLRTLWGEYKMQILMLETGQKLASSFMKQGLIDEIFHFLSPCYFGDGLDVISGLGTDLKLEKIKNKYQYKLVSHKRFGGDICLRLMKKEQSSL